MEKIDVIAYSDDPAKFVASALSPAKVDRVRADAENKIAFVEVPEDQLSLAIGKVGQNVRLAAKLTGWKVDIKGAEGLSVEDKDKKENKPEKEKKKTKTTKKETKKEAVKKKSSAKTKTKEKKDKEKKENEK